MAAMMTVISELILSYKKAPKPTISNKITIIIMAELGLTSFLKLRSIPIRYQFLSPNKI
jgi:hypothetical protein